LGVGTNAPISPLNIQSDTQNVGILSVTTSGGGLNRFEVWNSNSVSTPVWNIGIPTPDTRFQMYTNITLRANGTTAAVFSSSEANFGSISGSRVGIKGTGATSATTSLLVQNSSGTTALQVQDNLSSTFGGNLIVSNGNSIGVSNGSRSIVFDSTGATNLYTAFGGHRFSVWNTSAYVDLVTITGNSATASLLVGTTTANNSAIVNISSTTQGFLPPRMTTTQKNAIGTPAAGLMVYDTTLNKLCVYTTAWETITSV
jgi:hypothetical protein